MVGGTLEDSLEEGGVLVKVTGPFQKVIFFFFYRNEFERQWEGGGSQA